MNGLNGSAIQYVSALSPLNVAGAGSSNAFNIGATGRWLNVVVATASDDLVVNVERSGTSNGTFAQTGLSIAGNASGIAVRGMPLQSSAIWYKVSYDMEGNGSAITSVLFEVQGQRDVPILTQDTNTTVYSDVIV
jgi:hypothetical protein